MNIKLSISCICVTNNSVSQLKRAIRCFKAQTYENKKELVILFESDNTEAKEYLKEVLDSDILKIEIPFSPKLSLGELRNIAIQKSTGEYFCQWDDDDWYASNRLEFQMNAALTNAKPVSMLLHWLMFDATKNEAYVSPFRLWEGSILCKKSIINEQCNYAALAKGEDTILLDKLIKNNLIFPIIKPGLYIYVYHGNNTWNYDHFNYYYKNGLKLSQAASLKIKDILDEKYTTEKATEILNSEFFLNEIEFRFELIDNYRLTMK